MSTGATRHERLAAEAARGAVREILDRTARDGLPGDYHFYLTFATRHPGVDVAAHLAEKHPEEMTVVLQHMFWGLEVGDDAFEVTLSFSGRDERLRVPFEAVTGFTDPSVAFRLLPGAAAPGRGAGGAEAAEGNVVAFDAFRRKKS